nr:ATP-binding protein [Candidatus Baldrarchaeota archaeon]
MRHKFCRFCSKFAATTIRYSGLPLCKKHFVEYLEKRVFKTVKKYRMIQEGERILLGVSGGKDSIALLHILKGLQKELKFEIIPLFIDLGIQLNKYS